ncbi:MAG TPA: alpha/beta hydrolase [Bacillota bacterium]|nr:alpha/beta hydrolase [Bacillota bacterium]HPW40998.1 alpha/beta hydrolase [Bacillota bacterium]
MFFKTDDDAFLYYQDAGEGNPIVFLHGWSCTCDFWKRNIKRLSEEFRVITIDFRGHGASSKVLHGHTIPRYARDIKQLFEYLNLNNITLIGWSMAVTVVLSYYEQYSEDGILKSIGLIDGTPAPFLDEEWNYHRMKKNGGDVFKMNKEIVDYVDNPRYFAAGKAMGWLKEGMSTKEDIEWITNEILKTPPWISYAIFTDFLHRDYTSVLNSIELPVIVFCPKNRQDRYLTGKYIADKVSKGRLVEIDSGHLPFYEKPKEFNEILISFIKSL